MDPKGRAFGGVQGQTLAFFYLWVSVNAVWYQFSIYMPFCAGTDQADRRIGDIGRMSPAKGQIHGPMVTNKQFAAMVVFRHGERSKNRGVPEQLVLF